MNSDILVSIVYGIVQGVTEFLPVSSSGHLVVLHWLFPAFSDHELAFDVALHAGTFLAVTAYYARDLVVIARQWLLSLVTRRWQEGIVGWLLLMGSIPAALAGYFFEDVIEAYFRSSLSVALMLVLGAVLFYGAERLQGTQSQMGQLSWRQAVGIGCAQALALVPGVSRSGITIVAGMLAGLKREAAVQFSFLLSVPITFGAAIKKMPTVVDIVQAGEGVMLVVGCLAAFCAGLMAIKYFLRFVQHFTLMTFAYYRVALAIIIVVVWALR